MSNARKTALEALIKVESGGFSTIVLDNALDVGDLTPEDKQLASNIFYGVIERKLTLEYYLNKHLKKPLSKLPDVVKTLLLVGAYQIIYLEKVPDFAAVNESVKMVSRSKFSGFKGLVNGVLRNVARGDNQLDIQPEDAKSMSVYYSVDQSIAQAVIDDYGVDEARKILASTLLKPEIYIRKNILKQGEIEGEKTEIENCYILKGSVKQAKGYDEGLFYVQDMSSQLCCLFLDAKPTDRVLDCCAAPGGKSFTIAQYAKEVVSCDLYQSRVDLISSGAKRLGLNNITVKVNDASVYDKTLGEFDKVLCDAPCSGLGVMRRKPDIKYKKAEDLKNLCKIQFDILSTCSKYVKAGGEIVYSTCTLLKSENEDIVNAFLAQNSDFELVEMKTLLPCDNITDGFFMAKMLRRK